MFTVVEPLEGVEPEGSIASFISLLAVAASAKVCGTGDIAKKRARAF